MWRMMGRGGRRDRGAVSTIVVTLFFCGGSSVILAMLAMSVDVGNVLAERRQLQNGADAASMMLAQQCAKKNTAVCAPGVVSGIANIASANAADQKSAIASVCFNNVPGVSIQPCPTSANSDAGDLGKCNPLPLGVPATTSYVQVTTSTLTDSGSTLFTPFARALASSGSGPTVIACARAAWGPPKGTGPTLPLIITRCAYDGSTASGTKLVPAPPYSPAPKTGSAIPSFDISYGLGEYALAIEAHDSQSGDGSSTNCGVKHNGQTYPGGFSWVTPAASACAAQFNATGDLVGVNGASPPQPQCKDTDLNAYLGTEVFVPVAKSWTAAGTYVIDGVASFYMAGYENLGGSVGSASVYIRPSYVCSGCNSSNKYVWGWFTSGIKPVGSIGEGQSLGASVVQPVG